jgi:hypothetical protein
MMDARCQPTRMLWVYIQYWWIRAESLTEAFRASAGPGAETESDERAAARAD